MSEPRVPPRPVADWDDEARQTLSVLNGRPVGGQPLTLEFDTEPVPGMIATFAWHPALTRGWLAFSKHLSSSTLPDRVREILILRTSWLRRGEYEWSLHVGYGIALGLSEAEIEAISVGPDDERWSEPDAALLRAVDEMCLERRVSDATWHSLAEQLDRRQLMDLVFTVGAYDLHAMAFNTFGLELDPGMAGFGDETESAT